MASTQRTKGGAALLYGPEVDWKILPVRSTHSSSLAVSHTLTCFHTDECREGTV